MKFQIKSLVVAVGNYLKQSIGALSVLLLVGQIAWWVAPPALASPLVVATSADSVSTQVSGKADELKGAAKQEAGKAQSQVEDKSAEAERKVKANARDAKNAVDRQLDGTEDAAENLAQKVKNFFSK